MKAPSPRKFQLVSESTRKFIQASREAQDYTLKDFLHGYIYGRWIYLYIGLGKGEHPLAKKLIPVWNFFRPRKPAKEMPAGTLPHSMSAATETLADGYHGKSLPLESAKKLVSVNQPLHVPDLEHVIPYVRARAILQENPDHIVVLECPCRTYKETPCLPLDVCLVIGEPFASFIMQHNPEKARWITQEEAAKIIEQEDARGHVHHAFFKDAMLGRFYAICNCCACCCGAMNSHKNGTPMLACSGYLAEIDQDLCIGCWTCEPYCQFGALILTDEATSGVVWENCMGCGVCVNKCPEGAIELVLAPEKGVPLEIEKLMQAAIKK